MRHTKTRALSAVEQMEQEAANLKAGTDMWKKAYNERVSESTERLLRIQKLEADNADLHKALEQERELEKKEAEVSDDRRYQIMTIMKSFDAVSLELAKKTEEITELKARWEKLEEIEHEYRTIEGKQWISLGLLKRRMQELEKKVK
jgi:hypothetical protein